MPLTPLADGLWCEDRLISLPAGLKMPIRMTVMRGADGALTLVSPVRFDEALAAEVSKLGEVRSIVGPNLYHHLFLRSALEHFPKAELFLAPGLAEKRAQLPASHVLGGSERAFDSAILPIVVAGAPKMSEVVFVHEPSRTLVVTDLLFNIRKPETLSTAFYLSISGTRGKLAQSRAWRFLVSDRAAHRASLDALLGRPLERLVMAHGEVLTAADAGSLATRALLGW